MRIFRKPDAADLPQVPKAQVIKIERDGTEKEVEGITVFKGERKKGVVQDKGKNRNAPAHGK